MNRTGDEFASDVEYTFPNYTLTLDSVSGALKSFVSHNPHLQLIQQPELGENFRLLIPRPGMESNYFFSNEQVVASIEQDQTGITVLYTSLRNLAESIDVDVRYRIECERDAIELSMEIRNHTDRPVAEVMYGIIGGIQGIGDRSHSRSLIPGAHSNLAPNIFHTFPAGYYGGGNLGIPYSACGFLYPGYQGLSMSWTSLYNVADGVGVYYGSHDSETRLTGLYYELRPFSNSAVLGSNWPTEADMPDDEPTGLTMGWLNFPFARNTDFVLGPVRLEVHRGDWRAGSTIYRRWFDKHFPITPTSWLRREMAWQSTIMRNPEDVTVHRFDELAGMAADAKNYGVRTFEICGWDAGGIDRGYPDYTPDPELGSRDDFRTALRDIKDLGVKPMIFANLQFADTGTERFRTELHKFAVHGRWAPDYSMLAFGEGTISARMGLTASNMAVMNMAHDSFRREVVDQMVELVRDGAAAIQFDKTVEVQHLDFNDHVSGGPDRGVAGGLLQAFAEVVERGREIDPEFSLASETWWDRTFQYVDVLYSRMGDIDMPHPSLVYTFPEITSSIFAENPGDFNVFNNGMRYGMLWAIAPRHYSDSMAERLTQPLSRYLQELIRIRSKHADVLYFGQFEDSDGADVTAHPAIRYSTFRQNTGKQACVVVNYGDVALDVEVDWSSGVRAEICQPFESDRSVVLPTTITLPARSCAVVVELEG